MTKLSEKAKKKLQKLGVGVVYLFGSRAQGAATALSDYDVGVVFADPKKLKKTGELYTEIYNVLIDEIPVNELRDEKLDISFLQKANAALQAAAIKNGIVLFEADPVFRADFEEQVVKNYDDYLPIKREFEQATFAAFK